MPKHLRVRGWPSASFDQVLLPPHGYRIQQALLTTYSADLPAIVVALCALAGYAGDATDRSSPGRIALAQTLHQLRRADIRIAFQSGRLRGGTRARIAALLDRYVHPIQQDELKGSWHPKMAILRFVPEESGQGGMERWRFWMGSRNLATAENAELGLTLDSSTETSPAAVPQSVPGLARRVAELAERSGYAKRKTKLLRDSLEALRWHLPEGCTAMSLFHATDQRDAHGLPPAHIRADKIVVVSPFLNATTLRTLAAWGKSPVRILLSTRMALGQMAACSPDPLAGFAQLLELAGPEMSSQNAEESDESLQADEEAEFAPYRRLHAKLIAVRESGVNTFYFGSANATQRGWNGSNEELVARLQVTPALWDGLEHWYEQAQLVERAAVLEKDDVSTLQKLLEIERARISFAWSATLFFEPDHTSLVVADSFVASPQDGRIALSVGLYTQEERYVWPGGQSVLLLEPAPPAEQTSFVRLSLEVEGEMPLQWIQCCAIHGGLHPERDTAALGSYLGAAHLLTWWKSLLHEGRVPLDGDTIWNSHDGQSTKGAPALEPTDILNLEDMLRAWARSPQRFQQEGAHIGAYVDRLAIAKTAPEDPDFKQLQKMKDFWEMLVGDQA